MHFASDDYDHKSIQKLNETECSQGGSGKYHMSGSLVDAAYLLLRELLPVHSLCLLGSQPLLPVVLEGKQLLLLLCPHPGKGAGFI